MEFKKLKRKKKEGIFFYKNYFIESNLHKDLEKK